MGTGARRGRRTGTATATRAGWALALCVLARACARGRAFKGQDFKTCETSSFCARLRDGVARDDDRNHVLGHGVDVRAVVRSKSARVVELDVVNVGAVGEEGDARARVAVEAFGSGAIRVRVDDVQKPRYVPKDVLVREVEFDVSARALLAVTESAGEVMIEARETGARARVRLQPFAVEVFAPGSGSIPSAVFNKRGGFAMELAREESGEWSETFNGHTDTRKGGPTGVAFDVTFPFASDVYGIPERATSLSLKSTRQYESASKGWFKGGGAASESERNESTLGEPYRMYNLDVFEYLDDSPFGLYGSIPMMTAHGISRSSETITSGVYFHNPSEMYVDVNVDGSNGVHTKWMAESGAIDVFILPGTTPGKVLQQYTALTGTTSMPPLFSLGYHQCRWNYRDENDVKEVDKGFDEHDIPYDVLWLDIEHTDGKRYMTWDKAVFPTPQRMIEDLSSRGRKMVTIVDPHVKRDEAYPIYKEAKDKGFYVKKNDGNTDFDGWCWPGSSSYLDVTNPDVREWWAGKFSLNSYEGSTKDLYIWNDMNEPSVFNGPEITMQKDLIHHGGVEHRDVHNAFGMYYHMATAEGLKRRNDGNRPFVLSRAFFAGTQRVGPIWTGDNAADWKHLAVSLPMVLTLGVSGLTFSGADVGGFFGNPDAELMTRWYQVGTYYPFFRGHAHLETKRREPWLFGEENTAIIRDAIRERYALLPYIYTLFEESHRTGAPVMRPLWYEFPADADVLKTQDAFMLGTAMLIRPVLEQGAKSVSVYLPKGIWYEKRSGVRHVGPKSFDVAVSLSDVPVFLRGGTIFVRKDRARRSTTAMRGDPLTVIVALDENGRASGTYYADDGESYEFASKKSAFMRRRLTFSNNEFNVAGAGAEDGNAGDAKSFIDHSLIERVTVHGLSATGDVATCAATRDSFDVVRVGAVANIRRPNLPISRDFTIAVQ
ncbi:glycosyl hydrolases family 31-domain-containing protein [Ostreococcus tauri]|nr:glycosyl hydrolases family 31-domain-containing protein [Ostreococcus tauri]